MRFVLHTATLTPFHDKERSERQLFQSGLAWTCIYPVFLTDGSLSVHVEVHPYEQVVKVMGMPKVSRADVARVMLDAAENPDTIGSRLLVTTRGTAQIDPRAGSKAG